MFIKHEKSKCPVCGTYEFVFYCDHCKRYWCNNLGCIDGAGLAKRANGTYEHVDVSICFKCNRKGRSVIGRVKSAFGKSYEIRWDQPSRDVYVSYAGWSHVGKASSAREAMNKAEAWLYNK